MTEQTKKIITDAVAGIAKNYEESDILMLKNESPLPDRGCVIEIVKGLRSVMFPGYFEGKISAGAEPEYYIGSALTDLYEMLLGQVTLAFSYKKKKGGADAAARKVCDGFFEKLPAIQRTLLKDVRRPPRRPGGKEPGGDHMLVSGISRYLRLPYSSRALRRGSSFHTEDHDRVCAQRDGY